MTCGYSLEEEKKGLDDTNKQLILMPPQIKSEYQQLVFRLDLLNNNKILQSRKTPKNGYFRNL